MFGVIAGDIIGSIYEHRNIKRTDFELFSPDCRFTDDTVLTVAIADSIINNIDYAVKLREYGRRYPNAGYGGNFYHWIFTEQSEPYYSYGNGSAMRVSPVGFAFNDLETVLSEAEKALL